MGTDRTDGSGRRGRRSAALLLWCVGGLSLGLPEARALNVFGDADLLSARQGPPSALAEPLAEPALLDLVPVRPWPSLKPGRAVAAERDETRTERVPARSATAGPGELFADYERQRAAAQAGTAALIPDEAPAATVSTVTAASVMTDSLFGAGARADVPREVMERLANLFLYDVDFVRDIRAGDRFEVVYEVTQDASGQVLKTGEILFAAMSWRGGRHAKAYYRFEDQDGEARYFDADGASAQRSLMKTPIEGARVTSRFGPRRHPTLGYTKAHKGVDFGAARGTPIMAAGDGEVLRANRFGSYGNFLLIRHPGGFETAYAHLHGFAPGVRPGATVRQGQVVAFVGSTGRSTGPHLHYEVRRGGAQVNPMRVAVAQGTALVGERLDDFRRVRTEADAMRSRPLAVAAASGATGGARGSR